MVDRIFFLTLPQEDKIRWWGYPVFFILTMFKKKNTKIKRCNLTFEKKHPWGNMYDTKIHVSSLQSNVYSGGDITGWLQLVVFLQSDQQQQISSVLSFSLAELSTNLKMWSLFYQQIFIIPCYRWLVLAAMWAQTQDQFTIPQPGFQTAGMVKAEADHGSVSVKSHPFHLGAGWQLFCPAPTLLPREDRLVACVILWLAVFLEVGGERGVANVLWSHNQLFCTFYILIRGSAGGSNKQKEILQRKNTEEEEKAADVIIRKHQCNIFTRSPSSKKKAFYFCIIVF